MIHCFNTFNSLRQRFPLYSRWVATLALLLVVLLLSGPLTGTGSAQEGATVRLEPLPGQEGADAVTVAIHIENATRLYGAEVHLAFDPTRLEVQDADPDTEGVQIQVGDFPSPDFVVQNQADNARGTIDYAATQLAPREAVDGSGVLATVTVKGKDKGTSSLTFVGAKLADPDGQEIPSQSVDGQVEIAATAVSGGMHSGLLIGAGVVVALVIVVVVLIVLKRK
ncbi:MAG: hypothetical protein E3J21_26430 [Anaerolineales bacterium]|nr:MAG: hypothetical protein E3J21_26430 [Anaerolineales bacterium]